MPHRLTIAHEDVALLPQKCLFLPMHGLLVVADVHLGKVGHFRQAGIAIPRGPHEADLDRLSEALRYTQARQICFLGDLFHSHANADWHLFEHWLSQYPNLECFLVVGNHDVHGLHALPARLKAVDRMPVGNLMLTHEPAETGKLYNLCGHLHPAVRMRGAARQSLILPCFYFNENRGVLPAFGEFTGAVVIRPQQGDRFFAIAEGKVVPLG